jgi:streptogrisin C
MLIHRIGKATAVGAAAMLFATLTFASPALAEPSPDPTTGPPPNTPAVSDVDKARESLDYLMNTYKITQDEALRRLRLQARASGIVGKVRGSVGDELIDFWMDQDNGGKLTFLTSKPDVASKSIAALSPDLTETRFVQSKHTAAQLKAAQAAAEKLMAGRKDVKVELDASTETIRVRYSGTDKSLATQVRTAAGKTVGDGVEVAVDTSGPEDQGVQHSCSLLSCDTPMRGGVRMHFHRDPNDPRGDWGSCTTGFNIRSNTGWSFILTAGHCVQLAGPRRNYAYHNGLPLVWEKASPGYSDNDPNAPSDHAYWNNNPGTNFTDWALMPYQTDGMNWSGYWLNQAAHNLVASSCTSTSQNTCNGSTTYAMQGVYPWSAIGTGWVVCATGTGTKVIYPDEDTGYSYGTRCGTVQRKNQNGYCQSCYGSNGQGIKVNICGRDGDSGGPLFSQLDSMAYGILSGGLTKHGPCTTAADDYSVYSSVEIDLANAAHNVTQETGVTTTFWVIDTATG